MKEMVFLKKYVLKRVPRVEIRMLKQKLVSA